MDGHGSIVFLSGPRGSGKTALIDSLVDSVSSVKGKPDILPVPVACHDGEAGVDPLGPFWEILANLTDRDRWRDRARRINNLIEKIAPELFRLIPVFGDAMGKAAELATGVVGAALGQEEQPQVARAGDFMRVLRRVADEIPLLLIIDDAQWIHKASTQVIEMMAPGIGARHMLLVVAYDPDLVDDLHPVTHVRYDALLDAPDVAAMDLRRLELDEVEAILLDRYQSLPGIRLTDWLLDRSNGSLLWLKKYLASLELTGILRETGHGWELDGTIEGEPGNWRVSGALADMQTPDDLAKVLSMRVATLDPAEDQLLEYGAFQGTRFLSSVVARVMEEDENQVGRRLRDVGNRHHIITPEKPDAWWRKRSNQYAFDPSEYQTLFYARNDDLDRDRIVGHRRTAEALEEFVAADRSPPRHVLLEIARHYEAAEEPVAAARLLVEIANSTLREGADRETVANAERAVGFLRMFFSDGTVEDDDLVSAQDLLSRAIVLVLLGGDAGWRASNEDYSLGHLVALADEAETLTSSDGLRANACFAKARVLTAFGELRDAVTTYQRALVLAELAGDPVTRFAVLINLGHHLASENLEQGWERLQEAHHLITRGALAQTLRPAAIQLETARLESRLGAAAFDLGRYGDALEYLTRCTATLRARGQRNETAKATTFLGQLYTAIGMYEKGEAALLEAIASFADEGESLSTRGYLRALLGRLYVKWQPPRIGDGRAELAAGREETVASGRHSTLPLVDTYWAEWLLAEGSPDSLREADATLAEVATFGWARGEIASSSVRARIALAEDRVTDALALSTHAVDLLEAHGGSVPTVQSEEVFLVHAQALTAGGAEGARGYAQKAEAIVKAKADSLQDDARTSFLEHVQLSLDVLEIAGSL
jgi:tetratricopeptide (TPR) repeat protein